jgi:hypothetical protein
MALYAPLINANYFAGELEIGQLDTPAVAAELNLFIRRYEVELLQALMGKTLFEAFHTAMKGATPADKWKRMAYGDTFILDISKVKTGIRSRGLLGYTPIPRFSYEDKMQVQYKGLMMMPENESFNNFFNSGYGADSAIAQYVYYWWMRKKETTTGGAGEKKAQVHNAIAATAASKMVTAYNNMCYTVFHFYLFLDMNASDYPEFDLEVNARFNPGLINTFNFL